MSTVIEPVERLFACALRIEHYAAKRLGESVRVGMGCKRPPTRPVVSFGFAGALVQGLPVATVIDATKVVDENGEVLWQGKPLGVPGAHHAVVMASTRIVNAPGERAALAARTGADVVDMESGVYARRGLLAGCVRVISDTPEHNLFTWRGIVSCLAAGHALYTMTL